MHLRATGGVFLRKTVRNCRSLNMQTIRVRRERPASLAIALVLAVTMLIVYLLTLQAQPQQDEAETAASLQGSAEIRMEAMDMQFLLSSIHDDPTQAHVAAALCAQNGGAGIVTGEANRFAVIYEAGRDFSHSESPVIRRSAPGLTLRISAPADTVAALTDGLNALHALAAEAGPLAASLEKGETDAKTAAALLDVYRTGMNRSAAALNRASHPAATLIRSAMETLLSCMDSSGESLTPGKIRAIHTSAALQWLQLLEELTAGQ